MVGSEMPDLSERKKSIKNRSVSYSIILIF